MFGARVRGEMAHAVKAKRGRERAPQKDTGGRPANLVVGDLSLNVAERSLSRGGNRFHITPKMCALLQAFMANQGKVVTRQFLMKKVWKTDYMGDTRTLDVHIHMLRKVLGDDSRKPAYLHTVRRVGYRLEIPDTWWLKSPGFIPSLSKQSFHARADQSSRQMEDVLRGAEPPVEL